MNVLMIWPEFPDTFWSFKHALRFVNKRASNPPLGLLTVAAMLPTEWNKRLVDINIETLKDQDLHWADMIFLSAMTVQRDSVKTVLVRCKAAGKLIVAGGPLFTGEWQDFPEVDHFILNEAELTLPPFLNDFKNGTVQPIYQTVEYPELTNSPVPAWELVKMGSYDSMGIQFSRGCPFNCDFCNITAMLGHRPRVKSARQIIAELDKIYSLGWRRNIFFVDDNFIGNKRLLKEEVLPALIEWRKDKIGCLFITEVSINLADDEELMQMMTDAGFVSIFVGIETPDEASLAECHKNQNKGRNLIESVHILQRRGLQVMGGFIVGFDNDTPTIFQRQLDFIQESGIVTAMVGLLQAPFGTRLYQRLDEEGRLIKEMSGDNTDGSTNIIPKMEPNILYNGYQKLVSELYAPRQFYQRVKTFLAEYQPPSFPIHMEFHEIAAFFRSIYWIGLRGKDRRYYWNLFFWSLLRYPKNFALAITFSIYGYHFRKVSELHVNRATPANIGAIAASGLD